MVDQDQLNSRGEVRLELPLNGEIDPARLRMP